MPGHRSPPHPETPYLLLNRTKVARNIARLQAHLASLGVALRPHVKTAKSLDVIGMLFPGNPGPITVSTLAEAAFFAAAGYRDLCYAVGIAPAKLDHVARLRAQGVDISILLDSVEQADAVAAFVAAHGITMPTLIEIDCDGHRGGIRPDDPLLPEVASRLGRAQVHGVLTHAGESYFCYTDAERSAAAENERRAAVQGADVLRSAGYTAPVVSVGSTPTAFAARDLAGVTEVRAGNFVFFDLVMAGIGVCTVADIALSVAATVIGHRRDKGWLMTDAGWTALSADRGTSRQRVDQGFGLVATRDGHVIPDLVMVDATQEHGVLAIREGSTTPLPDLPVGSEVRILPNHACATATQHRFYHVLSDDAGAIEAQWERINGW